MEIIMIVVRQIYVGFVLIVIDNYQLLVVEIKNINKKFDFLKNL
jgi:hypothetical protein